MTPRRTIQIAVDVVRGAKFGAGMAAFEAVADAVGDVVTVIKDASVESVKLAAAFQQTSNALAVYTGSLTSAQTELRQIEELARNTTGLRLESAEKGYQQLRALGFEAKLARGFIKELGEEKILSGASDDALSRIAINFSQIASGGQKVSQELREMLNAMPSLRTAFYDAFGSLDPQKIQTFFDRDTDAAMQRLFDTMAKGKQASGGLNDALGKLSDEWILAGRAFGEPLLDPLTGDIKDFTNYLRENQDTITEWGVFAKHELATAADFVNKLAYAYGKLNDAYNWSPYGERPESAERLERKAMEQAKLASRFSEVLNANPKLLRSDNTIDFSQPIGTREEIAAQMAAAEQKRLEKLEKARQQELVLLQLYGDESNTLLKNQFAVENALRDAQIRYTTEQEKAYIGQNGQAVSQQIKTEIAQRSAYFSRLLELNSGNSEELQKITSERNKTLSDLNTQLKINEINTAREIAEAERKIREERRQAAIQFKQLQINESTFGFDSQTFDAERLLSRGSVSLEQGYARLKEIALNATSEIRRLTNEQFALQLQDQTLSVEQRANVVRQMYFEERKLAEENRRNILSIEDRLYQDSLRRLEESMSERQSLLQKQGQIQSSIFGAVFGSGDTISAFTAKAYKSAFSALPEMQDYLQTLKDIKNLESSGDDPQQLRITKIYRDDLLANSPQLDFYRKTIQLTDELLSNEKKINATTIDALNERILKEKQVLELRRVESQIADTKTLVDAARDKGTGEELRRYQNQINQLQAERSVLITGFVEQRETQFRQQINGLKETLNLLKDGDTLLIAAFQNSAQKQILQEQISLIGENIALQERLAVVGADSAERYKNAWLSATLEVKEANIQAVEAQIAAQVRLADASTIHIEQVRARVLEHLASAKTATDALADGIISAFDKSVNFLNDRLGKIGDIPVIGDLLKFGNQQFLSNITTNLLDRLLPSGFADALKPKSDNPVVNKINDTNKILSDIRSDLRGGGAATITNVVNAGRTGGVSGALGQLIQGINGGGLAFPSGSPNFNPFFQVGNATDVNAARDFVTNSFRNQGRQSGILSLETLLGGGAGTTTRTSLLDRLKGVFSARDGGFFGKGGIFGKDGFGNNTGTYSAIGSAAQMLGGLFGSNSRLGRTISYAGQGLGLGASIGSMILPGIGTAIGAILGSIGGGVYGLFSNPQRKRDEALRSQFRDEAVAALNRLITSARGGDANALSQGEQVRSQYIDAVNTQLRDAKTKRIALNELNPPNIIYQRYEELKKAAQIGLAAADRRQRILPEFAGGNYFGRDDQMSEMVKALDMRRGYINGGRLGVDRHLGLFADGEMILNQRQQRNIIEAAGFDVLAFSGVPNYPKPKPIARYAEGASFGSTSRVVTPAIPSPQNQTIVIENLTLQVDSLIGTEDATEIYVKGAQTDKGQRVTVRNFQLARRSRKI